MGRYNYSKKSARHLKELNMNKGGRMSKRILIIEPSTVELRRLREILSREGFEVVTAVDVETAKIICREMPIYFVLADANIFNLS